MPRHPIKICKFRFHACEPVAQERPLRLERKTGVTRQSFIQHCASTIRVGQEQWSGIAPVRRHVTEMYMKRMGDPLAS